MICAVPDLQVVAPNSTVIRRSRRPGRGERGRDRGHGRLDDGVDAEVAIVVRRATCRGRPRRPAGRCGSPSGVPVGDHGTEVEHVDVVAEAEHEAHVVVDEQDRQCRCHGSPQMRSPSQTLSVVSSPAAGSSSSSTSGLPGERPGDRDELALALAQLGGRALRQRGRAGAPSSDGGDCRRARPARLLACADGDVLLDGEVVVELESLERAAQPELGPACGAQGLESTVTDA